MTPALGIDRLCHFAPMHDLERRDQAGKFAGEQQVSIGGGPPALFPLGRQETLDDEQPALAHCVAHPGKTRPVEIVEHEHGIEQAPVGPGVLEIGLLPVDLDTGLRGKFTRRREHVGIAINGYDVGAQLGGSDRMPAGTAGQVEDAASWGDPVGLPGKPGTGPRKRERRVRRHVESDRPASLKETASRAVDLLVIGGGIVGAGVARDAAMRGLRTVLVEQNDLAFGTSSRSSRLIHGGLRYLEHGELRLVFESLRERAVLRHIAPHLVWPLPFVFPVHDGDRLRRWQLAAGMWMYDLLSLFRNVSPHKMLGKRALLTREPGLRATGLRGGARYFDAQCDDARLVVATARSAHEHGATILTYTTVTGLTLDGGRVTGAHVRDVRTGKEATFRASIVVNATGPWVDQIRRLEDPKAPRLLRLTKGTHAVVPRERMGNHEAITFTSPLDGRVMFVLPWGAWSYIGTTDTDTAESPDEVRTSSEDIRYLLRSANSRFPNAHLGEEDVIATWAGLRPLIEDGAVGASSVSREHIIADGPGGMVTVAGGKLTTYRRMAAQVVDHLVKRLNDQGRGTWPSEAGTELEPLPGGESASLATIRALGVDSGIDVATVEHMLRHYGTEAAGIFNLMRSEAGLADRLQPDHPAVSAEVLHAARKEFALMVADVLVRRIHLFFETRDQGAAAAARTAELLGRELGWTPAEQQREVAAYRALTGRTLPPTAVPELPLTFRGLPSRQS